MKKILANLAVVCFVMPWLLFGQASPRPDTPLKNASAEQKLIKLEDGWNDALVKSDAGFLDRLMTDDYMDTDPGGAVEDKAQSLAPLKSGDLKYTSAVNDQYKVHVYGNAAVINFCSTVKGKYQGRDIGGKYRVTDIWVKSAGHWQCAAAHLSKMAE
jgi:ketosteroid isomerase-like protein